MNSPLGIFVLFWLITGAAATAVDPARTRDDWSERGSATVRWSRHSNSRGTLNPVREPQQPTPSEKPKPKPIEVTGTVRDRQGTAVVGAKISITGPDGYQAVKSTDANGEFKFEGVDGAYQIAIEGEPKPFPAMIAKGQLKPNEFTLTR